MYSYGEKLKSLRKEKGETQEETAKVTGLSVKTIYRYEHALVKRCDVKTIEKLADCYDVEPSYILEDYFE